MRQYTNNQRLFFALWPEPDVSQALARLGRENADHQGRLIHPEDIHLTLIFLGQATSEQSDCVQQAAESVGSFRFELSIDHTGHWPRPRIFWAVPSAVPESLILLVKSLQKGLKGCGFEAEKRPYAPHITLIRKVRRVAAATLDEPLLWRPREFVLATSSGASAPPRYQVLNRWSLGS